MFLRRLELALKLAWYAEDRDAMRCALLHSCGAQNATEYAVKMMKGEFCCQLTAMKGVSAVNNAKQNNNSPNNSAAAE